MSTQSMLPLAKQRFDVIPKSRQVIFNQTGEEKMETNKKNPPGSGKQQGGNQKSGTKNNTIMSILRDTPLHRFKAEAEGDHCLPSTIASLTKQYGLEFPRQLVKVPNRFGGETSVMEYSTSDSDKEKIDEILGVLQ